MTRVALGQETPQEGQKAAPPATPQDRDTLDRIERLERELQELKARQLSGQTEVPTAISLDNPPSTGDVDFRITFTDGFHVKSSDGNFDLHIGGRVEEVYREIFDRPILPAATGAQAKLQPNTFYFHELFLSMDGTIYKDFGFKINGDFAPQGVNATNPTAVGAAGGAPTGGVTGSIAEQAWLEWKHYDWLHIQFGQFKSPNEAESIESPLFQEVVNRSPMSRFVQNWETGMQIYGSVLESLFTYNVALMNGRGHLANAGRSLVDDNDGKEVDWRLTVAPFVQDADSIWLRGLRVGWWGSYAREGQGTPRTGSQPQGFPPAVGFQSTDFGVSYLEFGGAAPFVFHGARSREGAELTYVAGPFEIRGEVMERRDEFFITGTGADRFLGMKGYYGQVSCILTGEDKIPDTRIVPRHPLDPLNGDWGALELAARFGGVTIDRAALNEMFAPANPIAANSNRMTSLAAGFNWWFTKNTKLAFDYVTEHYYDGILFAATGPNVDRKHLNGFLAQIQLDF
jgi:phosphate-selective porin OprO/OprP